MSTPSVFSFSTANLAASLEMQTIGNIFDNLPSLTAPKPAELLDELDRYLSTDPEHTENVFAWWTEHRPAFPRLSRMALDYLSIPGARLVFTCSNMLLCHL
jgi:hypothetical protein